ncbi:MAG: serine hydrolase [Bacteroidales bacterium]|jgi:hypothetical protein
MNIFRKHKKLFYPFLILIFLLITAGVTRNKEISNITFGNKKIVADTSKFINDLLNSNLKGFDSILKRPDKYEVQIIYTQINRDKSNKPSFKQYSYRLNSNEYFNPASLVKLPTLCTTFEKLNNLKIEGLSKYSRLKILSSHKCQVAVEKDTSSAGGFPSIANYAKKILLISDNDAYSRLYEFLGQEYLNKRLWNMGYPNALIIQRFAFCGYDDNRFTNPFIFFNDKGDTIYKQQMVESSLKLSNPLGIVKKGKGYINGSNKLVNEPCDFTYSNNLCLEDINNILLSVIFPEVTPQNKKFNLTNDDYNFLYKYMSMLPKESVHPTYKNDSLYWNSLKKYFIYGDKKKIDDYSNLKSFNIVGQAFGYLSDCAYIVDFDNKIEFILSAVIYVNEDQIFNDNKYEYFTIGLPFLANVGKVFYNYELKRKKAYLPNLEKFKDL